MINPNDLASKVKYYVTQIELLAEEQNEIQEKTKLAYSDAKSADLDIKAIKQIVKERKMQSDELLSFNGVVHLYRQALDMAD
jgi:uncharacterized protein (UPF0335 family)